MGRTKQFTEPRTPMQVRVHPKVRAELKKLAAKDKRTLNNYLSMILEAHIRTAQQPTEAQAT
jgi:mRNA-degrading endonuclease RelE of RelBE toxin-antitoxin system